MNSTFRFLCEQIGSLRMDGMTITAIDKVGKIYVIRKLDENGWRENGFINPRYIKAVKSGSGYIKIESELPLVGTFVNTFTF